MTQRVSQLSAVSIDQNGTFPLAMKPQWCLISAKSLISHDLIQ